MRTITLVSLGLGGAGVATGAGFAISSYIGGESIREHIEKSNKSKNKVFLVAGRAGLDDIKTKYDSSQDAKRPKPKDKDGKFVTKENLVDWCSDNVNSKFNNEEGTLYKSIISWCFINSNTLSDEMDSDGRQIYSKQGNDGAEWQTAWDNYSKNQYESKKIKPSDSGSKLNGNEKVEGGKALEKWCTEHKTKKLYEDGIEEAYELFKLWCTKPK